MPELPAGMDGHPNADGAARDARRNNELAEKWLKAIEQRRNDEKNWRETKAPAVIARFRDDRGTNDTRTRFNILWANTETLKPAIFSKMPTPDVRRRFATNDPAARTAALIMERALSQQQDTTDAQDVYDRVEEDYLLPGRGVSVVRYKPTFAQVESALPKESAEDADADEDELDALPEQEVIYHEVYDEYVPWNLFVFGYAKSWCRVPWIAIGSLLRKAEVKAQYPDFDSDLLSYSHSERVVNGEKQTGEFALLWDVWHKASRKFIVVAHGYTAAPLKIEDDPLQLENFYPVAEPIYSVRTNNSWTPVPEFVMYQDQAMELDDATERLAALTDALKIRGVYDQSMDNQETKSLVSDLLKAPDLTLMPIANFRALVEKGGMQRIIDFIPIEDIYPAIAELRARVADLKAVIYEVTGISDIVRGATQASETLGAQQLKAQYSGLRISTRQGRFARYMRDCMRIKAEIMAEHYDAQTLLMVSGIQVMPDEQWAQLKQAKKVKQGMVSQTEFMQAVQILKSDKLRGFRIEIETDSTIPADKEGEQNRRIEFLGAIGQYMQQVMPAVQAGLIPASVAREGMLFGVRAFKVGSEFEEVLDQLGDNEGEDELRAKQQQMQQQLAQMQEENQKLKQDNQRLQASQDVKMFAAHSDAQIKAAESNQDMQINAAESVQGMQIKAAESAQQQKIAASKPAADGKKPTKRAGSARLASGKQFHFEVDGNSGKIVMPNGLEIDVDLASSAVGGNG